MKQIITLGLVLLLLTGCNHQVQKKDHSTQRELFSKSLKLIDKHKEIILKSSNLNELDSLFSNYEEELGDLNMKFPGKTDFEMAENENDTLCNRIMEMLQIRDSIKKSFSQPLQILPDTTELTSN